MKRMVGVLLIGLAPHRTQSSQARSHILCSAVLTPDPILPGLFLPCSLPQLLSAAAGGSLEPSPVRRFRGAFPHRLLSYAKVPSVADSFAHGTLRRAASVRIESPGTGRRTT